MAEESIVRSVTDDPYAGIAAIYDHWCAEVTEDVPFYRAVCDGATGPIVEIGGGTGRIAIPLALAGHRVIAVDLSRPMLDRLTERAAAAGVVRSASRASRPTCGRCRLSPAPTA